MTDLTNQAEKIFKCPTPGCAALVPASGKDEHKKGHRDAAALRNRIDQFLTRYEGSYLPEKFAGIDERIEGHHEDIQSIDEDLKKIEARLDVLEARPTAEPTAMPDGLQISGWLDDTDQPTDDTEPAADIDQPQQVDGFAPFPTAETPAYTTATNPAEVDDFEARIIAAQTGGIVR